jgi:5'/3'-nucleotidase SurE
MNPGNNLGQGVNHSGTVNAATTALELGVPSVAVSLETPVGWREGTAVAAPGAATYVADLVERLQTHAADGPLMPAGVSLNVNLPVRPGPIDPATGKPGSVRPPKGERLTTVATSPFLEFDYKNVSGQASGVGAYTIQVGVSDASAPKRTDIRAVTDGYVSVTPLEADRDLDGATQGWLRTIL